MSNINSHVHADLIRYTVTTAAQQIMAEEPSADQFLRIKLRSQHVLARTGYFVGTGAAAVVDPMMAVIVNELVANTETNDNNTGRG